MSLAAVGRIVTLVLAGWWVSTTVWAFEGLHREIDWVKELQLSATQQQQLEAIEQRYQPLRKEQMRGCQRDSDALQGMREEMHQVLTLQQRETARTLMRAQHQQMQLRHTRELAHRLNLPAEQKDRLLQAVENVQDDYQWPLDIAQHGAARQQYEALLESHLTADQVTQWQQWREQRQYQWARSERSKEKKPCRQQPGEAG